MKNWRLWFGDKTKTNLETNPKEEAQKTAAQEWRYGVAGNITKTHYDSQGILRYGSSAFCGGTKVYLCGKYWRKDQATIGVIGLDRCKRIVFDDVSPQLVENVRCTKVYKPSVLKLMNDFEFEDCWWDNSPSAKKDAKRFVEMWNEE